MLQNIEEHFKTRRYIAQSGKPFEPNIPHHFSFRGGDDVTYVVSAILAARVAKSLGVPVLVLQNMLNTPRSTWGVQDIAKARVMLERVRSLEDGRFSVVYQPRAGLDYFSHDLEKARIQLVSTSMLMDDVEPTNNRSPEVVHVVSYSEAAFLATPPVIDESVRLTRAGIRASREQRRKEGSLVPESQVLERVDALGHDVDATLAAMEQAIPDLLTPAGLTRAFESGFLIAPYLWECREQFREAVRWPTRVVRGAVVGVDQSGLVTSVDRRLSAARAAAMTINQETNTKCAQS